MELDDQSHPEATIQYNKKIQLKKNNPQTKIRQREKACCSALTQGCSSCNAKLHPEVSGRGMLLQAAGNDACPAPLPHVTVIYKKNLPVPYGHLGSEAGRFIQKHENVHVHVAEMQINILSCHPC